MSLLLCGLFQNSKSGDKSALKSSSSTTGLCIGACFILLFYVFVRVVCLEMASRKLIVTFSSIMRRGSKYAGKKYVNYG